MSKTKTDIVSRLISAAARNHSGGKTKDREAPPKRIKWPVNCTVGPGLEGAIAAETKIGYVNGSEGRLIYRGYDIFDLCANSSYEEVCYLLLRGNMPVRSEMNKFQERLIKFRYLPNTLRKMMGVPLEEMSPMSALRLGTDFMRQRLTWRDVKQAEREVERVIASDEDSIPMETRPMGHKHAIYEFKHKKETRPKGVRKTTDDAASMDSCLHLISGLATIAAGIARLRGEKMPIEPDPNLSHAANFLYMTTGRRPSPEEARIMDVALILHADHGINASTFAAMVVASTMSDIYSSVSAGIGALNGPLHGGANEHVVKALQDIGRPENVKSWFENMLRHKKHIPGFGHRIYKTYDPRALILKPLAEYLVKTNSNASPLLESAMELEKLVIRKLGHKGIFPNVDFYSGIIYTCLGISTDMFPTLFAVSRVAGWTSRVHEYLKTNRIFRPRAIYVGDFNKQYHPIGTRRKSRR